MNLRKGDVVRLKPNPNNEDHGDMFVEKVTVTVRGKEDGVVRDFKLSSLERGEQVSIRCMDLEDVLFHLAEIYVNYDPTTPILTANSIKELCETIKYNIDSYKKMNNLDTLPILDSLSEAHGIDISEDLKFIMHKVAESESGGDKEKYQRMIKLIEDSVTLQNIERAKL